jgi:hypothetical protein
VSPAVLDVQRVVARVAQYTKQLFEFGALGMQRLVEGQVVLQLRVRVVDDFFDVLEQQPRLAVAGPVPDSHPPTPDQKTLTLEQVTCKWRVCFFADFWLSANKNITTNKKFWKLKK